MINTQETNTVVKETLEHEIHKTVLDLSRKACTVDPADAMRVSQAALNLANAFVVLRRSDQ